MEMTKTTKEMAKITYGNDKDHRRNDKDHTWKLQSPTKRTEKEEVYLLQITQPFLLFMALFITIKPFTKRIKQ